AIVRYISHGVAENGARYIVMEWLDGEDLATKLDRELPSIDQTIALGRRTAEALAHAHAKGVVHRDIKPGNLFLPAGDIKRGADVFSLGCVLFQCLTGRPVFEAEAVTALLAKILLVEPPRVRDIAPHIPAEIDAVLAGMLAKDPEQRTPDAIAVLEALDGLAAAYQDERTRAGRVPRTSATVSLTASERRIACVVIAGASPTVEKLWSGPVPSHEEMGIAGRPRRLLAIEEALTRQYGARIHPLPDGSVVVSLPDSERATDQAARAARCALAMRGILPDVPLVVSTGHGRFSTWSAVGDVIDNGALLLRGTAPGAIRLDDVAAGLLDARFEVFRDGTAAYLRAERDGFGGQRQLLGKATPFVGRGREMSMLTNLYAATAAESTATAVLVVGSAGVGKSRLRQELLDWVQRQPERAEVFFGGVDSVGAGSPFAMLARLIRRAAGILDGEPIETRREKLAARVGQHVAREIRERVTEFLGEIADVRFDDTQREALRAARANPQLMGDGMRRAFEDWLMAECAAHPVLLILEDLHWGDLGTVSFLDSALRNLNDHPFMVLALARPEVEERFPDLWTARHRQTIRLGPLSRRAAEQLVKQALSAVTDDVVARIVERADGNAFYLEELIRALAAGRAEGLPDSVLAMVQARLDSEGAEGKRVLRAAAVFGERFSRAGIAALLGSAPEDEIIIDSVERLAAHELIARAAPPLRQNDVEYVFAHALVREAAYAMLTDEDRQLGHRLAGVWLEQAGFGDSMVLANHFRRGGEPARAVPWYERAAAQALAANDLGAAIDRAETGIQGGAAEETVGRLRLIQAESHVWRGELAQAEARALEAAAALPWGGADWFRARGQAVIAAAKRGSLDVVEEQVREVEAATSSEDPDVRSARIICLCWAASYLIFGARYAVADPLMATIGKLAEADAVLDPQALALLQQVRAVRASSAGDLGRCLTNLESALQGFEQAGYVYCELGDFQRAEAALRQALLASERMGLHEVSAGVLHNLGRVLGFGKELAEAERLERAAVEAFCRQGERRLEGAARIYLADILTNAGDLEGAVREAGTAVETLAVAPSLQVAALAALARARLAAGDVGDGVAAARQAHEALERLGEIEEGESAVRWTYAEALRAAGDEEGANAALLVARQRLLAQAERIADVGWRQRFLHEVPINAKILALPRRTRTGTTGSHAAA